MNILLVCSGMQSGGAETHILSLCHALMRMGHKITLASSGGALAGLLSAQGVRCVTLPLTRITPRNAARALAGLFRLVRRGEFDAVHAHTRVAALYSDIVCKALAKPLVVTCHAHFCMGGARAVLTRTGERCIAVSEDIARHVARTARAQGTRSVSIVPNGIDTHKFCPSQEKPSAPPRIIFVSRLDSDCSRAAHALCTLAPRLVGEFEELEILIVGGGDEYRKIALRAQKINAALGREAVRTLGESRETVPLLQSARVFVGVSRAALEAMSCALPVVLCGDEGFIGLLDGKEKTKQAERTNFCCRDCKALSASRLLSELLRALRMSEAQRGKIGECLREYVCRKHSESLMAQMTQREYERASRGALLCGYYGFGNLGDEALLAAAKQRAEHIFGRENVSVLTHIPRAAREYGRMSLPALLSALRRSGTLVLGGGTLLQNDTSRRSLAYYLFLMGLARALGRRVELWGNGLQGVHGRFAEAAVRSALRQCAYVGVRDVQSAHLALLCGVESEKIHLEGDLAANIKKAPASRVSKILSDMGVGNGQRYAIVAAKGSRSTRLGALSAQIKALAEQGILPIFIAMYPREDSRLARALQSRLGGKLAPPMSPEEAVGLMSRAHTVLASRYHAVIFARAAHVQVRIFSDEEKLRRLLCSPLRRLRLAREQRGMANRN